MIKKNRLIDQLENISFESNITNSTSTIIKNENWYQISTPGSPQPSLNCIYRSQLTEKNALSKIEEFKLNFINQKIPFRWHVTPNTKPDNFEKLLELNNFKLKYEATAMVCESNILQSQTNPEYILKSVDTSNIELYAETFIKCWELPAQQSQEMKSELNSCLLNTYSKFIPIIAFYKEIPIGTSALLIVQSGATLVAGTVDKNYRGKGVYRSMVAHRARMAEELGFSTINIHAKKYSAAPICRKLGFIPIYDYKVFEHS